MDLDDGIAALLEWYIVVVTVRGQKDFWVPDKALAGREVGDLVARVLAGNVHLGSGQAAQHSGVTATYQPDGPILTFTNFDCGSLLFGKCRAYNGVLARGESARINDNHNLGNTY